MTPEEHYTEAERLLAGAQNVMDVAPVDGLTRTECAELAQVHATLALYRPEPKPITIVPTDRAGMERFRDAVRAGRRPSAPSVTEKE